jgi:hypothetical protein
VNTRSIVFVVSSLVSVATWHSRVWAEPESASPASKTEARERFDRGVRLFEKGDNAGALAEFKRANELIPTPLVLYNMGLVYAAMNRPVEAVDSLGAFLAQAPSAQRGQRKHAQEILDEQSTRIARLMVKTAVPATLDVDGIEVGRTPLTEPLRVASGAHIVGAQAPGYLSTRKEVTLPGQLTQTLELQMLPSANRMAQLWLTTSPAGAEVFVNGQSVGTTPLPASVSVAPGNVQVVVRRIGYLPVERILTLGDGARGDVAFALEEDMAAPASSKGFLRIVASEPGAEVMIDGVARPSATAGIRLPQGRHDVRVVRTGFEPYEKGVHLDPGGEVPLTVLLVPTADTRAHNDSAARTRKIAGWSMVGVGAATAIGGAIYAFSQFGSVSDASKYRDGILANEADWQNPCYANQGTTYQARGCDVIKADAQDRYDSAVLRRNVGFIGAGAGVLVAGIGTYLVATAGGSGRYAKNDGAATFVWFGPGGGGVSWRGRF